MYVKITSALSPPLNLHSYQVNPKPVWSGGLKAFTAILSVIAFLSLFGLIYAYRHRLPFSRHAKLKPFQFNNNSRRNNNSSSNPLKPIVNKRSSSASQDPLLSTPVHTVYRPKVEIGQKQESPSNESSGVAFTTRLGLGIRAVMKKLGRGPPKVNSNQFRIETSTSGGGRTELDLAEPDGEDMELDRGEYTLVAGGYQHIYSSWRNRLGGTFRYGHQRHTSRPGDISPFVIPAHQEGFRSDETVAVSTFSVFRKIIFAQALPFIGSSRKRSW
jgi:hypothetical protein